MSRVYVGNLDPRVTERDLEDEFRIFGVLRRYFHFSVNEGEKVDFDRDLGFFGLNLFATLKIVRFC